MSIPELFSNQPQTLLLGVPHGVTAAPPEEIILDVTIPAQQQTNWCWAAVSVGIARAYHDNPPDQCTLATSILGQGLHCCPIGEPKCNVTHTLEEPLGANFAAKGD